MPLRERHVAIALTPAARAGWQRKATTRCSARVRSDASCKKRCAIRSRIRSCSARSNMAGRSLSESPMVSSCSTARRGSRPRRDGDTQAKKDLWNARPTGVERCRQRSASAHRVSTIVSNPIGLPQQPPSLVSTIDNVSMTAVASGLRTVVKLSKLFERIPAKSKTVNPFRRPLMT